LSRSEGDHASWRDREREEGEREAGERDGERERPDIDMKMRDTRHGQER